MDWLKRTGARVAQHIEYIPWAYYGVLFIVYSGVAIFLPLIEGGVFLCNNDFGGVFLPSARYVLAGRPLDMYQVRIGIYPNANGPVGEIIIAGIVWVGRLFHLQNMHPLCPYVDTFPLPGDSIPLRMWISFVTAGIFVWIAYELITLAEKMLPRPLTHGQRWSLFAILLLSPPMWDSIVFYGHYEQIFEILFTILAIKWYVQDRMIVSGILLGIALLNRTADIFIIIPLFVALIMGHYWQRLLLFGSVMGGTISVVMLPFLAHDRANIIYSLGQFRAQEPILDGSFWTFFRFTALESRVQSWDSTVGLMLALVIAIIMIWRGHIKPNSVDMYRVIFATSLCFALTLKAVWGYYFTEPLVWGFAWVLSQTFDRIYWLKLWLIGVSFTLLMICTEARISYVQDLFHEQGIQRAVVLAESTVTMLYVFVLLAVLFWNAAFQENQRKNTNAETVTEKSQTY